MEIQKFSLENETVKSDESLLDPADGEYPAFTIKTTKVSQPFRDLADLLDKPETVKRLENETFNGIPGPDYLFKLLMEVRGAVAMLGPSLIATDKRTADGEYEGTVTEE